MFAAIGLFALVLVEYLRPQEYFPALQGVPLLHLATALALVGLVLDLRLGLSRLRAAPHLRLTVLFVGWCLVTVLVNERENVAMRAASLLIPTAIYLLVSHGIQSFRVLQGLCTLLLVIAIGLAYIGVDQGLSDYGCHRSTVVNGSETLVHDGRPCAPTVRYQCEDTEGAEPGVSYECEKVGLMGTQSIQGRVRYRGTLQDPNELALAISIALPFAFALYDRRQTLARLILVVLACAVVGVCTFYTQSRGGQLVFTSVLGVYFVSRFGVARGALVGALLALPILLLGGRSGAEDSTMERTICWWVGLHLTAGSPGFGVGYGRFTEHHYLTAHNSFVLAAAELGLPGLLVWSSINYLAMKTAVLGLRASLPPVARSWALALLASMTGMFVGAFFLSFAYKDVFWIYLGLTGVLYQAIRRHDPTFTVEFGARDLLRVALLDAGILLALLAYTVSKAGW